jgi:hypothetical protein
MSHPDYSQMNLTELELFVIDNKINLIKSIDFNDIDEEVCNKIFTRACENDNLEIIKFINPYCDKKIFNHGIMACLYFKHKKSASWIFYNLIDDVKNFTNYIYHYYQVFFDLNNFDAIEFLLDSIPKFTCAYCSNTDGLYPCSLLVGIRKNSYESVILFLDFLINNNDYYHLDLVLNLYDNHGFYTACKNNYLEIAKYLCEIKPYYHIEIENNLIKNYYIDKNYYNDVSKYNLVPKYKIK